MRSKRAASSSAASAPVSRASHGRPTARAKWTGIDVDVCRAVSAAIFGDSEKVKYVPTTAQQRFTALQSGEVDLLARTTTYTLTRDTALGFDFTGVNYYDGQGFMVNKKLGVKSAKEPNGATVCVQPGTTTELNLADYFRTNKMTFKPDRHREDRGSARRLLRRPLRRVHHGRFGPLRDPRRQRPHAG